MADIYFNPRLNKMVRDSVIAMLDGERELYVVQFRVMLGAASVKSEILRLGWDD